MSERRSGCCRKLVDIPKCSRLSLAFVPVRRAQEHPCPPTAVDLMGAPDLWGCLCWPWQVGPTVVHLRRVGSSWCLEATFPAYSLDCSWLFQQEKASQWYSDPSSKRTAADINVQMASSDSDTPIPTFFMCQAILWHHLGVQHFNSILTLSTQR